MLVAFDSGDAGDDNQRDDPLNPHGTNVSGIVAATAPGANLVVIDVFDSTPNVNDIIAGLNWVAGNSATYNIGAVNLSLGVAGVGNPPALVFNQIECPLSPASGMQAVIDVGVQPVVSSGNRARFLGIYQDGIADPACYPGAVSVERSTTPTSTWAAVSPSSTARTRRRPRTRSLALAIRSDSRPARSGSQDRFYRWRSVLPRHFASGSRCFRRLGGDARCHAKCDARGDSRRAAGPGHADHRHPE